MRKENICQTYCFRWTSISSSKSSVNLCRNNLERRGTKPAVLFHATWNENLTCPQIHVAAWCGISVRVQAVEKQEEWYLQWAPAACPQSTPVRDSRSGEGSVKAAGSPVLKLFSWQWNRTWWWLVIEHLGLKSKHGLVYSSWKVGDQEI